MKLIDYITGNRKGREARRIEREAMDDPFLHDALEGYDAVPGDPGDAIRRMQRRVTGAAGKLRRRIYWSAAAALLLCAGEGGYLLTLRNIPMQEPAIALRQDTPERSVPADSVVLAAATPEKSRPEAKTAAETPSVYPEETPAAEDRAPLAKQEAEYAENEKSRPGETVAGTPPPAPSEESLSQDEAALPVAADIAAERSDRPEKMQSSVQVSPASDSERIFRKIGRPASVRGRITDRNGTPLIGATVASGPGKGTVTDSDGNFSLSKIPGTDTLEINYLGYRTEKIPADTSRPIRLALQEDDEQLTECIVVGYGTQKPEARQEDVRKSIPVGGHKAYLRYLDERKVYPDDGNLPHGKVTLRFRIDSAGRPVDIEVIRSLGTAADREAVRLVREGPDWTPGKGFVRLDIRF